MAWNSLHEPGLLQSCDPPTSAFPSAELITGVPHSATPSLLQFSLKSFSGSSISCPDNTLFPTMPASASRMPRLYLTGIKNSQRLALTSPSSALCPKTSNTSPTHTQQKERHIITGPLQSSTGEPLVQTLWACETLRPTHPEEATTLIPQVPRTPESRNLATRLQCPLLTMPTPATSSSSPARAAPTLNLRLPALQVCWGASTCQAQKADKALHPGSEVYVNAKKQLPQISHLHTHPAPHHPSSSASKPL